MDVLAQHNHARLNLGAKMKKYTNSIMLKASVIIGLLLALFATAFGTVSESLLSGPTRPAMNTVALIYSKSDPSVLAAPVSSGTILERRQPPVISAQVPRKNYFAEYVQLHQSRDNINRSISE